MSIDASTHSLFGVSKATADLMVQEYGRYFGMPTACFRGGCLTGPNHAGTQLHGFLSYLMRCIDDGRAATRCSATAASRSATTSTRPTWSPRSPPSTPRRGRPPCTTSAAGATATARCWRRSRLVRGDRRRRARLDPVAAGPHRRSPLVDLRPRAVQARLPGWSITYDVTRACCARSTTATPSAGRRRAAEALRRDPGARRGRLDRRDLAPLPRRCARATSTTR